MVDENLERGKKGAKSELEVRLSTVEARLAVVENLLQSKKPSELKASGDKEATVAAKVKDIGVQDCVILCYGLKGSQTKQQVMKTLDIWGKPYGSWFSGGNFNNRLLKKGILRPDGKNEEGEYTYCLTMNGHHIYEEKLNQLAKS
jgi:hypothetical protein